MSISQLASICTAWAGTGLCIAATGYAVMTLWACLQRASKRHKFDKAPSTFHGISVLKPLYGADPKLYENLCGFCRQTYPIYELIFGVRDPADAATLVIHRLQKEFPEVAIKLVIDPLIHGSNLKVSNLMNILPQAKHDWLVLADSDISVSTDYLSHVTAPLTDPAVGIVTCLYYGVPLSGFWSEMGRLFINDWFAPSVRLSHAFGSTRFAFGSTIALRRETLQAIGGFKTLRDTLADDFWLGELTREAGLRTVLSDEVVGTDVGEVELPALWSHELRWLRTIRALAPAGFAMMFVCFTWPVLLLGLLFAPNRLNLGIALFGAAARIFRYFFTSRTSSAHSPWYEVLLTPFRDTLLMIEWAFALTSWKVTWRGRVLNARDDGPMRYP